MSETTTHAKDWLIAFLVVLVFAFVAEHIYLVSVSFIQPSPQTIEACPGQGQKPPKVGS